jgi:hypothetical protein
VVSHRGAFGDAFLLVLPGMAAGSIVQKLAETASSMVGELYGRNSTLVATQNVRVVPERPDACRLLLGFPKSYVSYFTGA